MIRMGCLPCLSSKASTLMNYMTRYRKLSLKTLGDLGTRDLFLWINLWLCFSSSIRVVSQFVLMDLMEVSIECLSHLVMIINWSNVRLIRIACVK